MRILILSDDFPPQVAGGAGIMAFRMAEGFIAAGHEVRVLSTVQDPAQAGDGAFEGISVRRVHAAYHDRWRSYVSLCNPRLIRAVERAVREFKPDIVHAHNVHQHLSYASLIRAKHLGAKVFMTAHDIMPIYPGTFTEFIDRSDMSCPTTFDYRVTAGMMWRRFRLRFNPFRNLIIRRYLHRIDGVIAVSGSLREALAQNGIPVRSVIYNGIDAAGWTGDHTGAWNPASSMDRTVTGTALDSHTVLFGGRLSGAKGGDLILQAMQSVVKHDPKARLVVVGKKDAYAFRMEEKGRALGLSNEAVVFVGWLDEAGMKKAYANCAVVVVPSVCFDSFPNGCLEGFAAGKPVVATCFGGAREIVQDGVNGRIVNPFNVPALADALSDLLLDPTKARRFGQTGRALVESKYTATRMVQNYISLFSE